MPQACPMRRARGGAGIRANPVLQILEIELHASATRPVLLMARHGCLSCCRRRWRPHDAWVGRELLPGRASHDAWARGTAAGRSTCSGRTIPTGVGSAAAAGGRRTLASLRVRPQRSHRACRRWAVKALTEQPLGLFRDRRCARAASQANASLERGVSLRARRSWRKQPEVLLPERFRAGRPSEWGDSSSGPRCVRMGRAATRWRRHRKAGRVPPVEVALNSYESATDGWSSRSSSDISSRKASP